MLLFIWILLILLGFIVKNSRILTFIQLTFAVLMMTFDTGNPDQLGYINNFLTIRSDPSSIWDRNPLFNLLNYIFGIFGQYNIALFLILILSFYFLYKGISFYTRNTSFVFSLYLISPFVIDGTQIRNFVAMCVWVYFSQYLYKAAVRHSFDKNAWIYLLGVCIVTLIHFSFMFTAIYVFVIFLDITNFKSIIFSFISIIFVIILFSRFTGLMQLLGDSGIGSFQTALEKINDYGVNYNTGSANARLRVTIIFYFVLFFIFMCVHSNVKRSQMDWVHNYYLFIIKLTIVSLPLIYIMNYSMEIYRMQRNMLVMFYILFALLFEKNKCVPTKTLSLSNLKIDGFAIIVSLFYLLTEAVIWNYDDVFKVMFHF